jgi:hypothetical protein
MKLYGFFSFWIPSVHVARTYTSFLLVLLGFIVPVNIYVIGDWLGTGIQFPLFRYQQTVLGTNVISLAQDLGGKTAFSILLWLAAVLLLAAAALLRCMGEEEVSEKTVGVLVIGTGGLFFFSPVAQYGLLLSGPAGFAIPVGVPFLLYLGWWLSGEKGEEAEIEEP